ncbi:MAG: HAD-IIA family hydrolase [Clostridia bacterium]|nr:HAD-IIA family hydrolase [Clostridia bacterium]
MNNTEMLKQIKLFLFDMDGTLYLGNTLFPFTKELLSTIKASGKRYLFMTNNSSKSVADYVKKLKSLGIEATADDFITSAQATAYYLKKNYKDATLYVMGTESLKNELKTEGFEITEDLEKVDLIVLGFDTELTFKKLEDVSKLLLTRDIPYIATNPDLVCPTEFGSVPDCGSVSIMLENVSGKKPLFIGKPSPLMPNLAMDKWGVSPDQTAVIGDRIYTDIKSGIAAGAHSILVLSGETTKEILEASKDKPELVIPDCSYIIDAIK